MAKSKKKAYPFSATAELLQAFQTRVSQIATRVEKFTTDLGNHYAAIQGLLERERIHTAKWVETRRLIDDVANDAGLQKEHNKKTTESLQAFQTRVDSLNLRTIGVEESASRENDNFITQIGINKKTTESLYTLRDSTARAFDNVTVDMKNALITIQRLNERLGKAESQIDERQTSASLLRARVDKLEADKPSAIDQRIVDSKLNGVYDRLNELEQTNAREALRKALPVLAELTQNKKLAFDLEKAGLKFDAAALFNFLTQATGWTGENPVQTPKPTKVCSCGDPTCKYADDDVDDQDYLQKAVESLPDGDSKSSIISDIERRLENAERYNRDTDCRGECGYRVEKDDPRINP